MIIVQLFNYTKLQRDQSRDGRELHSEKRPAERRETHRKDITEKRHREERQRWIDTQRRKGHKERRVKFFAATLVDRQGIGYCKQLYLSLVWNWAAAVMLAQ